MRYIKYNRPIKTDAVIDTSDLLEVEDMAELFLQTPFRFEEKDDHLILRVTLEAEDMIYGLGEQMGGINKRGRRYTSFCSDDPHHTPDKTSLYGAHNFFILELETLPVALFIDFPSKIEWDMAYENKDEICITIDGKSAGFYLYCQDTKSALVEAFLKSIGPSFLPPRWAFGYQQSRWSYEDAHAIRGVMEAFDEKALPIDAIYLDIDYMDDFKNFTVDDKRFPDFKAFVKSFKDKGVRLVPIIDAGCKVEAGYFVYDQGLENNHYCLGENDKPFVGAVWPGQVHFPDFLNPQGRKWFGAYYGLLLDMGIEGFWNDMNEPAIFYTKAGLQESLEKVKAIKSDDLDVYEFFDLKDSFGRLANRDQDYKAMYHTIEGQKVSHYDVHNLYGYNMTRAAAEGFDDYDKNKRHLIFSRASYVGMHRYGGIWTGDNHSWWEHLLLNVKMMPSLNMCGFMYAGADSGGFGGHADHELIIRWSQFSMFTPLFRNHACMGTRHQEPYAFDQETLGIMKNILDFRYAMISHLYSSFMKANHNHQMLFKPLSFVYDDPISRTIEDQLILADDLMLTPVCGQNMDHRYIYYPETILAVKMKAYDDYGYTIKAPGHVYEKISKDMWQINILENKLLILNPPSLRSDDISLDHLRCMGFVKDQARYTLYSDDGIHKDAKAEYLNICVTYSGGSLDFSVEGCLACQTITYDIMTTDHVRHKGVYNV